MFSSEENECLKNNTLFLRFVGYNSANQAAMHGAEPDVAKSVHCRTTDTDGITPPH